MGMNHGADAEFSANLLRNCGAGVSQIAAG